jgi:hypothetical protein
MGKQAAAAASRAGSTAAPRDMPDRSSGRQREPRVDGERTGQLIGGASAGLLAGTAPAPGRSPLAADGGNAVPCLAVRHAFYCGAPAAMPRRGVVPEGAWGWLFWCWGWWRSSGGISL